MPKENPQEKAWQENVMPHILDAEQASKTAGTPFKWESRVGDEVFTHEWRPGHESASRRPA